MPHRLRLLAHRALNCLLISSLCFAPLQPTITLNALKAAATASPQTENKTPSTATRPLPPISAWDAIPQRPGSKAVQRSVLPLQSQIAYVAGEFWGDEIYIANADGSNPRNLTNTPWIDEIEPAWSPDDQTIAYTRSNWSGDRNQEIYLVNADGSNPRNLTNNSTKYDYSPAWSPDGQYIAFLSKELSGGSIGIYILDVNNPTAAPRFLVNCSCYRINWSPDGSKIAFAAYVESSFTTDLFVINAADGSGLTNLTNTDTIREDYPTWSPDGQLLAFTSDRNRSYHYNVYIMNADGSNANSPTRLMTDPDHDHYWPSWAPGGQYIVFYSYGYNVYTDSSDASHLADEILIARIDGSQAMLLTHAYSTSFIDPAWSHSGALFPPQPPPLGSVVFVSERDGGQANVYAMQADGTNVQALTHTGTAQSPVLSPDGRQIVFSDTSSGNSDIYVMNVDGMGLRRLTTNSAQDSNPNWSPDGRQIVFDSTRGATRGIYVMDADGQEQGVRLLTDTVAGAENPAWSPDGRSIAFSTLPTGSTFLDIYRMNADGTNILRLTTTTNTADTNPIWSPDGKYIAFTSERSGHKQVYVMDADGAHPHPITSLSYDAWSPSWSPDSTHLIFASNKDETNGELYIADISGWNVARLTTNTTVDDQASWQAPSFVAAPPPPPTNGQIVFWSYREGAWHVYLRNSDGSDVRRVANEDFIGTDPVLSPDGRRIVSFTGAGRIYVVDINSSSAPLLLDSSGYSPVWSANSKRIAYFSTLDGVVYNIYIANADGSNKQQLTHFSASDYSWISYLAWSSTSKQLAFIGSKNDQKGIWLINETNGAITQMLTGSIGSYASYSYLDWSPDGTQLTYTFTPDRRASWERLYIIKADGTGARQVLSDPRAFLEYSPAWSPNSKQIVFTSYYEQNRGMSVYVINADGTGLRRLSADTAFNEEWADWGGGQPASVDALAGDNSCQSCVAFNTIHQAQAYVGHDNNINPQTGNYVYANVDLTLPDRSPFLEFRRIYSAARTTWDDDIMGKGWTHNFNIRLILGAEPSTAIFQEPNGARQRFTKSSDGTFTPERGLLATLTYDSTTSEYLLTLPTQVRYHFNNSGQLKRLEHIAGSNENNDLTFDYDANGRLTIIKDIGTNRYLELIYNPDGLLDRVKARRENGDPASPEVIYTYTNGELSKVTDVRSKDWFYQYDSTNPLLLTQVTAPGGIIWEKQSYDGGRLLEQRNGANEIVVKVVKDPDGRIHIEDGRVSSGQTVPVYYHYDIYGAFIGMDFAYLGQTQTTELRYDANYRLRYVKDANGNVTQSTWSANGYNLLETVDALGNRTSFEYDGYNNLTKRRDTLGHVTEYRYENTTYPMFFPTLVTKVVEAVGTAAERTTTFEYTANGDLQTITDAQQTVTRFCYDSVGRKTHMVLNYKGEADACGWSLTSLPPTQSSTENVTTFYSYIDGIEPAYSPSNQITTVDIYIPVAQSSSGGITYRHDQMWYDETGKNILAITNYGGARDVNEPGRHIESVKVYDDIGRLVGTIDALNRQAFSITTLDRYTRYEYDSANRLIRTTQNYWPASFARDYPYNLANWTQSVQFNPLEVDKNVQTEYEYDRAGNPIRTTHFLEAGTLERSDWTCYDTLNQPILQLQNASGGKQQNPFTVSCQLAYQPSSDPAKDIQTKLDYDANGNLARINDAPDSSDPIQTYFTYDALNRRTAIIRGYQNGVHEPSDTADQDVQSLTYFDAVGNILATRDANALITWMCYDPLNRQTRTVVNVSKAVDPAAPPDISDPNHPCNNVYQPAPKSDQDLITSTAYDALGRVIGMQNPLGQKTAFRYDALGRVALKFANYQGADYSSITVQNAKFDPATPDQNVFEETTYDLLGRITSTYVVDPSAMVLPSGQLIAPFAPSCSANSTLCRRAKVDYNDDKLQVTTTRNYKDGGQIPATNDANITSMVAYDSSGLIKSQTDAYTNSIFSYYDGLDRLVATKAEYATTDQPPRPYFSSYRYDGAGNLVEITDPLAGATPGPQCGPLPTPSSPKHALCLDYDQLNRQTKKTNQLGYFTQTVYDRLGQVVDQIDEENIKTHFDYDKLGRVTSVTENYQSGQPFNDLQNPDRNIRTSYTYDLLGNLTQITLPRQPGESEVTIGYKYDALNRRYAIDGALPGDSDKWETVYDKGNRITTASDPSNRQRSIDYNGLNLIKQIQYTAPSEIPTSPTVNFLYDPANRVKTITGGQPTTINFTYDQMDRVSSIADPAGYTLSYQYNLLGNRTKLIASRQTDIRTITYTYEKDGHQLNNVTSDINGATNPSGNARYEYDAAGRLKSLTFPDSAATATFTYDNAHHLKSVAYTRDGKLLAQFDYTRYPSGNIQSATEYMALPPSDTAGNYQAGFFALRNYLANGAPDHSRFFKYTAVGFLPVAGDWDGNGISSVGVYKDGQWILFDEQGEVFNTFTYMAVGWLPIVGDWDGNGKDSPGIYKDGQWKLFSENGSLYASFTYGVAGWLPVAGDWDGDGKDTIGIYKDGEWRLRNSLTDGNPDIIATLPPSGTFSSNLNGSQLLNADLAKRLPLDSNLGSKTDYTIYYGDSGWLPVVGDWNGDGKDTIGIYKDGQWYLRDSLTEGKPDYAFTYGGPGQLPITGYWGQAHGLFSKYYTNDDLTGLALIRADKTIDFDWQDKFPDRFVASNTLSVKWSGYIEPQYSETYTFRVHSSHGVRLWIDDKLIINNWDQPGDRTGQIDLKAGQHYTIRAQFRKSHGNAAIQLFWSSASQKDEKVPRKYLFPVDLPDLPLTVSTQTATSTATPTATISRTPTTTATLTPSSTATLQMEIDALPATPIKTVTTAPTATTAPSRKPTQTFTATRTPSATQTLTSTKTPTSTPTDTATPSNTPSKTATRTKSPTNTPTATITRTPTKTLTPSKTRIPSKTPTPTQTPEPTYTLSLTPTKTLTPTPSATFTFTPVPPRHNGQITFFSKRSGDWGIYAMDADGSSVRQVITDGTGDWRPAQSPNGRQIAFVATHEGNTDIYVINADSTGLRRVTNNLAWDGQPAWSPDGKQIAFASNRDGNTELYVMNADGSNPRRLTTHNAFDGQPSWSPDGQRIAFVSERDGSSDIYVMNADGSNIQPLTQHPAWDGQPAWSPDGKLIAFASTRGQKLEIYLMNVDGSDVHQLMNHPSSNDEPSWSPDGKQIVFKSTRDGSYDIYTINVDGSNPQRLTDDPASDMWPDWGVATAPPPTVTPTATIVKNAPTFAPPVTPTPTPVFSSFNSAHDPLLRPRFQSTGYQGEVLADSPVSYWRLGESSGTTAADSAGTNTGTITGGVTLGAIGALTGSGDTNTAMTFDGSTGYVSVPSNTNLNIRNDFTVEAWAKPGVLNWQERVVTHKGGYQYKLGLNATNQWHATVYIGGVGYDVADTTGSPAVGRWDHLVLTRSGSTVILYVNGVSVATTTVSGLIDTSTSILAIGRKGSTANSYFNGDIDEVAIYNTALSPSRIQAHYTAGTTGGPTATPTATPTPGILKLQYYPDPGSKGLTWESINPDFNIVNTNSTAVPLTELTIRYYFTRDGSTQPLIFNCWYTDLPAGCSSVQGQVVALSTPVDKADAYLEVSFTTGSVPANGQTYEILVGLHRQDWSNFDQSNDYSFDGTRSAVFTDWDKITLYRNGTLVWGTPADAVIPTATPTATATYTPSDTPTPPPTATNTPSNTPTPPLTPVIPPTITPPPVITPAFPQTRGVRRTINYVYDDLHRLISANYSPDMTGDATPAPLFPSRTYSYAYDLRGNRRAAFLSIDGQPFVQDFYNYNTANQITSRTLQYGTNPATTFTYGYDAAGNLVSDGAGSTYDYDAANRLVTHRLNAEVVQYAYNGLGLRTRRTANNLTTDYLLDLNTSMPFVLQERTGNQGTWYLPGLTMLGQQSVTFDPTTDREVLGAGTWRYYTYDGLGSLRQVIHQTGTPLPGEPDPTTDPVRYALNYDPYGNPFGMMGTVPSSLGFTGEMTDADGLLYLRARYYTPTTGTFLSRDPVEGVMARSGSRNGYSYVEGNPVNYRDPSGEFAPLLFAGLVVLLGGLTFGGLPAAAEWRVAHDCQCGDPSVRNADPLGFVAGRTAIASGIGLGLALVPELALPLALAGTGLSAVQAASYWNPSDPWQTFKRGEGIFGTVLGLASLPFAARATSEALNSRLWFLSRTDPLFHPDVVYPQVQGYLWQQLVGASASASIVDDSSEFYSQFQPEDVTTYYHGTSSSIAESIRATGVVLEEGRYDADFGKGFYMSTSRDTALWSAGRRYNDLSLVEFRVPNRLLSDLDTLEFPSPPDAYWSDFVKINKGQLFPDAWMHGGEPYDMITGPMVQRISHSGNVTFWEGRMQTSIHTQRAVDLFNRFMIR